MDWNDIENNWKQFKDSIKDKWNELTDDELDEMQGRRQRLEAVLQERYGRTEQEAREEVDMWLRDSRVRLHN